MRAHLHCTDAILEILGVVIVHSPGISRCMVRYLTLVVTPISVAGGRACLCLPLPHQYAIKHSWSSLHTTPLLLSLWCMINR